MYDCNDVSLGTTDNSFFIYFFVCLFVSLECIVSMVSGLGTRLGSRGGNFSNVFQAFGMAVSTRETKALGRRSECGVCSDHTALHHYLEEDGPEHPW